MRLKKPVVQRLLKLMEFRNSYPAFNGEFTLLRSKDTQLILEWAHNQHVATAHIDIKTCTTRITYTDPMSSRKVEFTV
jgi:sucrose phosphorylase